MTPEIESGWHSGISAGVCLAPMIPASRATASASPLGTPSPRSSPTTRAETSTRPVAVAVRAVTSLSETSTMRAAPDSSTWVSRAWPVSTLPSEVRVQHQHLHPVAPARAR